MSLLSIVIVQYDTEELLPACLNSIQQQASDTPFEILLVNNDPGNLPRWAEMSRWPSVRVIQNQTNLGYAAAANIGFRESHGENVLFLNPDIVVLGNSIHILEDTLKTHAQTGLVLPRLENVDGSLQYSCRQFYTYTALAMRRAPLNRWFPNHASVRSHLMADWNHDVLAEVDWGLGAAMMLRRSAVKESGPFDERFFLYFEDVDLCLGMWQRGWSVLYEPRAIMTHHHRRESARRLLAPAKWRHLASMVKFLLKHRGKLGRR